MPRAPWHKRTWGGARPGAGRPPGEPTRKTTIRVPIAVLAALEAEADRQGVYLSEVIVEALRRYAEEGNHDQ